MDYTLADDSSSKAARLLGLRAFRRGHNWCIGVLVLVGSQREGRLGRRCACFFGRGVIRSSHCSCSPGGKGEMDIATVLACLSIRGPWGLCADARSYLRGQVSPPSRGHQVRLDRPLHRDRLSRDSLDGLVVPKTTSFKASVVVSRTMRSNAGPLGVSDLSSANRKRHMQGNGEMVNRIILKL